MRDPVDEQLEKLAIEYLRKRWIAKHRDAPKPITAELTAGRSVQLVSGYVVVAELPAEDLHAAIAKLRKSNSQVGDLSDLGCTLGGCLRLIALFVGMAAFGAALAAINVPIELNLVIVGVVTFVVVWAGSWVQWWLSRRRRSDDDQ